ncbi:MAG: S-adenosylmethionine:tRNA ribosyltransferase-isomerase [Bacteroidetes bacterium]|nr:S-adenosylmethionine:tRNA ribosyltransferase-isomerase [Bacteroidota bacterium]
MNLDLNTYTYDLPAEQIAKFPLAKRDESKLLVFANGKIKHQQFKHIVEVLPEKSMLVFNETKVIQARLLFSKPTGARIEIFCLEPNNLNDEISHILENKKQSTWKCFVGNKKKWNKELILKSELNIKGTAVCLQAKQIETEAKHVVVELNWNADISFSEILNHYGKTPIPPYLERAANEEDTKSYQTVYARLNGAVAAPTAGLHFTPQVLSRLNEKQIRQEFLTLHVSAGTFQPISESNILEHPMHNEQLVFSKENIVNLLNHTEKIICVGTTSLRAIESLYWFGVGLSLGLLEKFDIEKLFPYSIDENELPTKRIALNAVLEFMVVNKLEQLIGETRIFIYPSYKFKMCDGLITNYHLPKSTLILLVAAFIGDQWKEIYQEALQNDYRFLSYGDSSLLLP